MLVRGNMGISTFKSAGYYSTLFHTNRETHTLHRTGHSLSKAELLCFFAEPFLLPVEVAMMASVAWSLEKLHHLMCCEKSMPKRGSLSHGFSTSGSKNTCWDKIRASETSGTYLKVLKNYFRINFQSNFKAAFQNLLEWWRKPVAWQSYPNAQI